MKRHRSTKSKIEHRDGPFEYDGRSYCFCYEDDLAARQGEGWYTFLDGCGPIRVYTQRAIKRLDALRGMV